MKKLDFIVMKFRGDNKKESFSREEVQQIA